MNKKGFTLIELLSSITIMGLIATITSINIVKIFDQKKEISNNNKESVITTAACVYIELNENKTLKDSCLSNGCTISTNTLIKSGLLKEDDVDKETFINIYKENNQKMCTIRKEENNG